MASFDTLESSVQDSRPVEVYHFTIGSTEYRWTSAEDDLLVGADTYQAVPISRSSIVVDPSDRRAPLTITVPADNPLASKYVNVAPSEKATLKLYRLQRDESPTFSTQSLVYRGTVVSVQFADDGQTAVVALQSFEAGGSGQVPRYTFMGSCNNLLFDGQCKVDPSLFNVSGPCTAVSGNTVTVTGLNAKPDQYFRGGYVKPNTTGDFRLILSHVGNVLTLLLPMPRDVTGETLQAFAGCNHLLTTTVSGDCSAKFDNAVNYGGFAFVPGLNPFSSNPWNTGGV